MSKHFENASAVIAAAGIETKTLACTGKAQAVTIMSSKVLAPVALPASLRLVNSQEEVEVAIKRVVEDEAAVITTLRGLALYTKARFAGETFDPETLQAFYDEYQKASVEDQRVAVVGTLRLLDEQLDAETHRCATADGRDVAAIMEEFDGKFDKFIEDTKDETVVVLLENFEQVTTMIIQIASLIAKADAAGESVESARDANREGGSIMTFMYNMMLSGVTGAVLQATLRHVLSADDFATVEALLEKEAAERKGDEIALH